MILDGSRHPAPILEAKVKGMARPIHDIWPDGAVRQLTFMYSACGRPVKVEAKRSGDRTIRTKEIPVIFPDDPSVLLTISRLMGLERH